MFREASSENLEVMHWVVHNSCGRLAAFHPTGYYTHLKPSRKGGCFEFPLLEGRIEAVAAPIESETLALLRIGCADPVGELLDVSCQARG